MNLMKLGGYFGGMIIVMMMLMMIEGSKISETIPVTEYCSGQCNHEVTWAGGESQIVGMTQTGVPRVYRNDMGAFFDTFIKCVYLNAQNGAKYDSDMIPMYGGASVECPSNCSNSFRGRCEPGVGCRCAAGYQGPDCVSVSCAGGQSCSGGRGTCVPASASGLPFDYCRCASGYSGLDCSDRVEELPPVPQLTNFSQFAAGDTTLGLDNPVFSHRQLAVLSVEMSEEDLLQLMDPLKKDEKEYFPGRLVFINGDTQRTFEGVGVRTKGAASRGFMKKSFRLHLGKFTKGSVSFFGQKVLLLKATAMTPDWTRERLSSYLLYAMGVPVQRMTFATLFINGLYRGVYQLMENVDEEFLKARFGSASGGLWKAGFDGLSAANFKYVGPNCSDYVAHYAPKTAFAELNCHRLIDLFQLVNTRPLGWEEQLEAVFDVDAFFRAFAAEALSGNWDGIWNSNNYFLYYDNAKTPPRFHYFRQDLDLSFGGDTGMVLNVGFSNNMREGNIWKFGSGLAPFKPAGENRLVQALLSSTRFLRVYQKNLQLVMGAFVGFPGTNNTFTETAHKLHGAVKEATLQDYWHRLDQSYSYREFDDNLEVAGVRRATYSPFNPKGVQTIMDVVLEWAALRVTSARSQLQNPPF